MKSLLGKPGESYFFPWFRIRIQKLWNRPTSENPSPKLSKTEAEFFMFESTEWTDFGKCIRIHSSFPCYTPITSKLCDFDCIPEKNLSSIENHWTFPTSLNFELQRFCLENRLLSVSLGEFDFIKMIKRKTFIRCSSNSLIGEVERLIPHSRPLKGLGPCVSYRHKFRN